jgi:tetratricopeptide (TPR) repeat protein
MGIKLVPRFFGGAIKRGLATTHWCVVLMIAIFLCSGCATTKDRGDRAFEATQYNEALTHYEVAIEGGSRDPDLYHKAAEAAVRVGDFSLAERYYSRAMRYGGGEEVARAMAEFYIATSNYTKAVRVLQELLETTDNPQSIFNNLGAALMYAGMPLDAESYLLVAQQMSPTDPVPYVNLGVLYDKHMRQPRLALGFYRCYLRRTDARGQNGGQRRKIEARVRALEVRHGKDAEGRFNVPCDKAYQPPAAPTEDEVRERLGPVEAPKSTEGQTADSDPSASQPSESESSESESSASDSSAKKQAEEPIDDDAPPPVIYRQGERAPAEVQEPSASEPEQPEVDKSKETLRLAKDAFAEQNHKDVVRHLERLPAAELDSDSMALYGRSLAALGQYSQAQRWLAGAVDDDPSAQNVAALFEVYRELGDEKKLHQLCQRFEDEDGLEEIFEDCPEQQIIEHLKNKQQ